MYRLLLPRQDLLRPWSSSASTRRLFSVAASDDIRARLIADLKVSMKNKDSFSSTTIRSVLAEVYAADKASKDGKIPSSNIFSLIKKAQKRRLDAAAKFAEATRADLAEKEQKEAEFLSTFLPPLLPEAEVVRILEEIISQQRVEGDPPKKTLSKVIPAFYAKVDKATVDPAFVKDKVLELVSK